MHSAQPRESRVQLGWLERQLSWFPYAVVLLSVTAEAQLGPLVRRGQWGEIFSAARPLLGLVWLLSALALACYLVRRATRARALVATSLALFFVLGAMSLLEAVLPEVQHGTEFQMALQGQLERRETQERWNYRGVDCFKEYSGLGWMGGPWPFEPTAGRVVFVGDSFLESAASKTLASRVESRLRSEGWQGDIVNLSKFSTAPDPEYRHRFHELAFEYEPQHIVMFLYAGNDLSSSYRFGPYHHPSFTMSSRAIEFLRGVGFDEPTLQVMEDARSSGAGWADRQGFSSFLVSATSGALHQRDLCLAYLAALAYSEPELGSWSERCWGSVLDRVGSARDKLKTWKRRVKGKIPPLTAEVLEEYRALFEEPLERRLEGLADLVARRYASIEDKPRILELLNSLPDSMRVHILAEPDSPALLLRALWLKMNGKSDERPVEAGDTRTIRAEYAKLMREFHDMARARGVGFSVVLIPEAGTADAEFQSFWSPLVDTAAQYAYRDVASRALADEFQEWVPLLDLGAEQGLFRGGYWKLDGHWNERGHELATDRVVTHLAAHLAISQ